jgi:hypothetical protein
MHFGKYTNKNSDPMGAFSISSPANEKQGTPCLLLTLSSHISGIFCLFPQSTAI